MPALTPKQAAFVREYLVDLNATQAAIRAGYSERTAGSIGQENLTKPEIQAAITAARERQAERTEITADMVLRRWWEIANADPQELMQLRRLPCPFCGTAPEPNPACSRCCGEGVTQPWFADTRRVRGGSRRLFAGVKVTKEGVEVKVHDQMRALENVARHLGMFVDRSQLLDENGKPTAPAAGGTFRVEIV